MIWKLPVALGVLAVSAAVFMSSAPKRFAGPIWPGEGYTVALAPYYGNDHVFATVGFNRAGHIAGYCSERVFTAHWFDGATNHDLGALDGYESSSSYDLNDQDQAVGISYRNSGTYNTRPTVACLWDRTGAHALRPLAGLPDSRAWAINDSGLVVGVSYDPGTRDNVDPVRSIPTVWSHGHPDALPLPTGATQGEARNLSADGQVVGTVKIGDGHTRACVWKSGRPEILAPLDRGNDERGVAINEQGVVVGRSGSLGVVWTHGRPTKLDLPGAPNVVPLAINSQEEILVNDQVSLTANLDVQDDPMIPYLFRPGKPPVRVSHLVPSGGGYQFVKGMGLNDNGQILAGVSKAGSGSKILILSPPR